MKTLIFTLLFFAICNKINSEIEISTVPQGVILSNEGQPIIGGWYLNIGALAYVNQQNNRNITACEDGEVLCSEIDCSYPKDHAIWDIDFVFNYRDNCHNIKVPRCWKKENCKLLKSEADANRINWEKKMKCKVHDKLHGEIVTSSGNQFGPVGSKLGAFSTIERTFNEKVNFCNKVFIKDIDVYEIINTLSKKIEMLESKCK